MKVKLTHIVVKQEDLNNYLSDKERELLYNILTKVEEGRATDGKPNNQYYICNIDEPYAEKVRQVIIDGERNRR